MSDDKQLSIADIDRIRAYIDQQTKAFWGDYSGTHIMFVSKSHPLAGEPGVMVIGPIETGGP